tara:strand:+ start:721 stop:1008 length:288 start_codon:yes stop_codon:yes gene_type:complete
MKKYLNFEAAAVQSCGGGGGVIVVVGDAGIVVFVVVGGGGDDGFVVVGGGGGEMYAALVMESCLTEWVMENCYLIGRNLLLVDCCSSQWSMVVEE